MLELDHLTVSGDVTFGKSVSLKVKVTSSNPLHVCQHANMLACLLLFREP